MSGTIRHTIVSTFGASSDIEANTVPVTVNFIPCPNRVDTISILFLYTELLQRELAAQRLTLEKRVAQSLSFYRPVFTNSRITNVTTKIMNPEGELITDAELGFATVNTTTNSASVFGQVKQLAATPGTRLNRLREQQKADVLCVFNWPDYNAAPLTPSPFGPIPAFNSTMIVSALINDNPVAQVSQPESLAYIVLHELGHLAQGNHEPYAPTGWGAAVPGGQGFTRAGTSIVYGQPQPTTTGTMMFHGGGTGTGLGRRIPYWSDPSITVPIYDQIVPNGPLIGTDVQIGSATQNMVSVIRRNGPKMANFFISTLSPVLTGPRRIIAGQQAQFSASVCAGVEPFLYEWTLVTMPTQTPITATLGANGQTIEFTAPSNATFIRIRFTVRDANGLVSALEEIIEVFTPLNVLATAKDGATLTTYGDIVESGTLAAQEEIPLQFSMEQNHPNPFSHDTEISFALPDNEVVKLTLYDALGREIEIVLNEAFRAGRHTIVLTAPHLPSGMYVYRLTAGQHRASKTMLLIK